MAKQTIMVLTDDLDGGDADSTLTFGFDDTVYEIDLSEANAKHFRQVLEPYLAAGTRRGKMSASNNGGPTAVRTVGPSAASKSLSRMENTRIRTWAANNGYRLADRGRIPQAIVDAYLGNSARADVKRGDETLDVIADYNGKTAVSSPPAALFSGSDTEPTEPAVKRPAKKAAPAAKAAAPARRGRTRAAN